MDEYSDLLLCLADMKLGDQRDRRIWKPDKKRGFFEKSYYNYLSKSDGEAGMAVPFKQIWRSKASRRMVFFA